MCNSIPKAEIKLNRALSGNSGREVPPITFLPSDDKAWPAHDVLRRPLPRPAMVHRRLIRHGVVGLHLPRPLLSYSSRLHRIVVGRRTIRSEDLPTLGAGAVLNTSLKAVTNPVPVTALLVDMPK